MTRRCRVARGVRVAVITAFVLVLTAATASAATAQEERQGAEALREIESGKLSCKEAGSEEFERVGEYVMGRMLGSTGSHEAMDEVMSRMMGAENDPRIHEAMGRSFAGCGGGSLPTGFARMMGALNAVGMMGEPGQGNGYGSRGSMGGYWNGSTAHEDDAGPSAAAMVGMMAVLIAAVAVAVFFVGRRRPRGGPLGTLQQRYAAGDLSAEEYQERKRLLEGT